ncbi:MAG: RNA polymerase sigma factor [Myxococcota bacterium]
MGRQRAQPGLHALMERYVDGDRRAFERLHLALESRLRGFLIKLVRDEAACDDLLQLTLLKAHLARDRFRVPGGDPDGAVQAWYFAIARNVAMDFLRDRHRKDKRRATSANEDGPDIVGELPDQSPNAQEHGEKIEAEQAIVEEVRAAIERLPPKQREVVELHKLRGMSMADIAARLDVREGAIRVRAHRAYKALARLLQPKKRPLLGYDDASTEAE